MITLAIFLLILFGIVLLLLEILVIPGVTVAGIGGIILLGAGIYLSYATYGTPIGHYTIVATIVLVFLSIGIALKSKTWNKISLHTTVDGKVKNIEDVNSVKVGDKGLTISRLAPMGKVLINNNYFEAKSMDTFIDENTEIIVTKIYDDKLIVAIAKEKTT